MQKQCHYAIIFIFSLHAFAAGASQSSMGLVQQCRLLFGKQLYQDAYPVCRAAAEHGDAMSQFKTGFMHSYGKGVEQNKIEATAWYRRAAEQGHASSQVTLGNIFYSGGTGLAPDKSEAFKWYQRAAEQGHAAAQFRTGFMYYKGEGVPENKKEAAKWIRRAAEQGDKEAQDVLGAMYDSGDGVIKNRREAAKWYRRSSGIGVAGLGEQQGNAMTARDLYASIKPRSKIISKETKQRQADLHGILYHAKKQ